MFTRWRRYEPINSDNEDADTMEQPQSFWAAVWNGPLEPQNPELSLWLENAQLFPQRVAMNLVAPVKYGFTFFPFFIWGLIVMQLNHHSLFAHPTIDGYEATMLRCTEQTPAFEGHNAECGLDGQRCTKKYPIGSSFMFKCPANCKRESWTYTPLTVGLDVLYHDSLIVGGDNIYRADSFICAAALHRGIISDTHGGCGIVTLMGPQSSFIGQLGNNTMQSKPFDTEFIRSFSFDDTWGMVMKGCDDKRNAIMWISAVALVVLGYMSVNTKLFVLSATQIGFWTVILASNPPWVGGTDELNAEVISLAARRLLPMMLAMIPIYEYSIKGALEPQHAHMSRALFWCVPFYVGIVENYSFGMIPIDRLTLDDLNGQAGAWTAFICIFLIVLTIIVGQAYTIWRAGKFTTYLTWYAGGGLLLLLLGSINLQTLRIHHYILALCFLPGTGFQTTPSLAYNGLLTGLFVAGIARWDFDSIIQTFDQLRRGGPELNTGAAEFLDPLVTGTELIKDIVLEWKPLTQVIAPKPRLWNGFSLIINDVERYRGNMTSFNLTKWALAFDPVPTINYVRIAIANVQNGRTGSFTMPGAINMTSGEWIAPLEGKT